MRPVLVVVAAFAFVTLLLAWSRWLAGRRWAAVGHLLLALAGIVIVAGAWPLSTYVATYEARISERPVAELFFQRVSPGRYRVTLTRLPGGRMQVVELAGDQWRMDLRVLNWSGRAAQLGLVPRCRIERLVSRSGQPGNSNSASDVTHGLAETTGSVPWLAAQGARRGKVLLTAHDITGPWQPMADGARFDVRLSPAQGIEVDPLNGAASDSLAER
jgi:hypothetical protein